MLVPRYVIDITDYTSEDQADDGQRSTRNLEAMKIPQVAYGSVEHGSAHGGRSVIDVRSL